MPNKMLRVSKYKQSFLFCLYLFMSLTEGEEDAQRNSTEQSGEAQGEASKSES